jgi:hypothetical protein
VTQTTEFGTTADDIRFRWNADLDTYEIMLGSGDWQALTSNGTGGYVAANGDTIYADQTIQDFAYSSIAYIYPDSGSAVRFIGYGIPTAAGDVPVSGHASYSAELRGSSELGYGIGGDALLNFDFGAGTLSGKMTPSAIDGWGSAFPLGTYDFVETVYSAGSTNYSGRFSWNGSTVGDFHGQFTGPDAAELIGAFNAPFVDPYNPGTTDTMHGAWAGRRN